MKLSLSIICLLFVAFSYADELSDCKCWEGYEAKKDDKVSGVKCYGNLLLRILPCNIPEMPRCKCSGNVTSILSDSKGVWCTEYIDGKEERRWACENKEDWDKFYTENPTEKP